VFIILVWQRRPAPERSEVTLAYFPGSDARRKEKACYGEVVEKPGVLSEPGC